MKPISYELSFMPVDFIVDWQGTYAQTQQLIFHRLFTEQVKSNMPCVILVTGKSGRGKSEGVLDIQDQMYNYLKKDFINYLDDSVIMVPRDYAIKVKAMLNEKRLKKAFTIQIDEARNVVGSANWASFVNQAINHINNMSRSVKPMAIFILTQFIKDVDPNTRRSIDYWLIFSRRKRNPAQLTPYVLWMDENNPDKPKLRKRRIVGIIRENGVNRLYKPKFTFERRTRPELLKKYSLLEAEKGVVLNEKMDALLRRIDRENKVEQGDTQIVALYEHFKANPKQLRAWAEFKKGKWLLKKDMRVKLGLTTPELKLLQDKLMDMGGD